MSIESGKNPELSSGEFEFSLILGSFKTKFYRAVEEQQELDSHEKLSRYRMFTLDTFTHGRDREDAIARFRLVSSELVHDLQVASQDSRTLIDVGLPVIVPDSKNPMLVSDSPLSDAQDDYFILFTQDGAKQITADNIISEVIADDPEFMHRAIFTDVVPMSKPQEGEG